MGRVQQREQVGLYRLVEGCAAPGQHANLVTELGQAARLVSNGAFDAADDWRAGIVTNNNPFQVIPPYCLLAVHYTTR